MFLLLYGLSAKTLFQPKHVVFIQNQMISPFKLS